MSRFNLFVIALVSMLCAGLGCGGGAPVASTTPEDNEAVQADDDQAATDGDGDVGVDGLLGTVPQGEVNRVFDDNMQRLYDCYSEALDELEEIEGQIEIAVEVDNDGSVARAYIRRGDLGSTEAEQCMIRRVERFKFKRQGSGIAHVSKELTLEAPYDPPDPNIWGESAVQKVVAEHQTDVSRCLRGKTGVLLTLYVGAGGVVLSAGISAEDPALVDGGYCLAEAARGWAFPDPGSKIVKVSVPF